MEQNKMPVMEDTRGKTRFMMKEAITYNALCNTDLPIEQKEFIRHAWYGKIATPIWNAYLTLSDKDAKKLITGEAVTLTADQKQMLVWLTYVIRRLIEGKVLPCSDSTAIAHVFRVCETLIRQEQLRLQQGV